MGIIKRAPALLWGILVTLVFLVLGLIRLPFIDALEYSYYDLRMRLRGDPQAASEIVMVDIDNSSIENLGRWPWPRSLLARGLAAIDAGGPRVIGLSIILSEPESNAGLGEIESLSALFRETVLPAAGPQAGEPFLEALAHSRERLDNDRKLEAALRDSGRVVLPVFLEETLMAGETDEPPEAVLDPLVIPQVTRLEGGACPVADQIILPVDRFLGAARGIGHINFVADPEDGTLRRERLVYAYRGVFVPSYTLRLAADYLNLPLDALRVELGGSVTLGARRMPTTFLTELLVTFKGPRGTFKRVSFFDVINDKIPAAIFKNKLVLVSASAPGILNPISTPVDSAMPAGEFSAHAIWSMLHGRFLSQPAWGAGAELGLILLVGLLATFVMPRLRAVAAGITFLVLLLGLVGGTGYLFVSRGVWLPAAYPVLALVVGYLGTVTIRYLVTEVGKEKVEGESAETNRMLGVSFQEQGMLDMAFEKFRRVPMDQQLKGLLYNLGLDYERKRQLNKAAAVYEYIEEHDSAYKDVAQRKSRLMQASDTMVFGDGFLTGRSTDDALLGSGSDVQPTLGRYQVMRQLGKGAMGVVYLGQDPRINRTTAIKTVRFSDDFPPDEAETMKKRFFREAESAGTLSHPNIVTIYDAGEEDELAYIAMEFLEGEDLEKYTKKDHLLPIRKVVGFMADVAAALDYAHGKGIVHRDIKPANIMLLASGVVKITDFGIARITATSQTQTGIVKGTPYYMSPEQISGQKVDGRSDIFSLGVMTYQLLTGQVPFSGDSPAALMHQILNVPHPDPRRINPGIYKPLVSIIDKALQKDVAQRYQRAGRMAEHLRQLGRKVDAMMAKKARSA